MILLYTFLFIFSVFLLSKKDSNFNNSLSPSLLLLVMMFLYSTFGGLFILNKTDVSSIYINYWLIQFLCLLGVIFSIIFNNFNLSKQIKRDTPNFKIKLFFIIIVSIHFLLYVSKYGGINAIFSNGYRLVFESDDTNLLNFSILGLLATFSLKFNMHRLIFCSSLLFFFIAIFILTNNVFLFR